MRNTRALTRFARLVVRSLRWRVVGLLALGLISSLTAGVGLLLLVPLLSLVGVDAGQGATAGIVQRVETAFDALGIAPTAAALLTLNAVVLITTAALQRFQASYEPRVYQRFVKEIRVRVYAALAGANWRHLVGRKSTDHVHLLTTEADRIGGVAQGLVSLSSRAFLAAVHLGVAVALSPTLTAIVVLAGIVLIVLSTPLTARTKRIGQEVTNAYRDLHGVVGEQLSGLKTLKAHGLEDESVGRVAGSSAATAKAFVGLARQQANVGFALQVGSAIALTLIVYAALNLPSVSPAALLTLLYLFSRMVPLLLGLQRGYQGLVSQLPSVELAEETLADLEAMAEGRAEGAVRPALERAIELRAVRFAYDGQDNAALRGVDLVVPFGRTTAVVGPSGSGKSTLADVLIGLLEPEAGSMLLDGEKLSPDERRAWRRRVAYVAQDVFLFHDSIRSNLLVAEPEADEPRLWDALDAAAAGFVRYLPEGLDTVVGDRGAKLSGGERQRLALARALLRDPDLLVLDEATSNLDAANEARVQEAIAALHGRVTLVVIAHRLATVREADAIHVMADGRIVESGRWQDLVSNPDGKLRAMAEAQGLTQDDYAIRRR